MLPEFLEALHPLFGRIAGDDRGIDGADRNAGNPFRLETDMAKRLIGAGLIGAERAAALQHQHRYARLQVSLPALDWKYPS